MIRNGFSAGYKFALIKAIKVCARISNQFNWCIGRKTLILAQSVLLSNWAADGSNSSSSSSSSQCFTSSSNKTSEWRWWMAMAMATAEVAPQPPINVLTFVKINRISGIGSIGAHTHIKINARYVSDNGQAIPNGIARNEFIEMQLEPFCGAQNAFATAKPNETKISNILAGCFVVRSLCLIHFHSQTFPFCLLDGFFRLAFWLQPKPATEVVVNSRQIKSQICANIFRYFKRGKKVRASMHSDEKSGAKRHRSNKKMTRFN